MTDAILETQRLQQHFKLKSGLFAQARYVHAVDDVSLDLRPGETLGLVGESGCGKSTLGRTLLKLYEPTSGQIVFQNEDITGVKGKELRQLRSDMQMVFQDPVESLNSRHTVGGIIEEPLIVHKRGTPAERRSRVKQLLKQVGLPEDALQRYPHEFSGGQRQRIGIARAIALEPKVLVCDESVSALDVSVQSQILNLLMELQRELNLSLIFISHDLSVVKHISDRIAVMYLGKIVELSDAETLYAEPKHPYTQSLIASIPVPDPRKRKKRQVLQGDVPSPINPPSGCRFHTRCPIATEQCKTDAPVLKSVSDKQAVACLLVESSE